VQALDIPPLCTFVSFVVDEVQMLEPQRTRRYTKESTNLLACAALDFTLIKVSRERDQLQSAA
jgi:hypothetical protein